MASLKPDVSPEPAQFRVRRSDLVRYAGASGDFNPIHWSQRVATEVGLPGVIAHGMYTLGLAGRAVAEWAGGADRVVELGGRFTKPVVVPDDESGVVVEVAGEVKPTDTAGRLRIDLTVTCGEQKVLGMARAVVVHDG
ncbi:MAG TPA: MaoC/PaaZ C-terminal domain-containing protein [Nocardioidaceae bacterium]|nr:MaoC/PaaZ C-terminal domain-containing protein [Nocardioidaceae bacterium]